VPDQWLIRTADNRLAGPYSREQVCGLIRDGRLTHQDEVCSANGYWIYLHEREEVRKLLGIDMPKPPRGADDEVTQTDTRAEKTGDVIPELPDIGEGTDLEQTSMLSNAALRSFRPRKKEAAAASTRAEVRSDAAEAARTPDEPGQPKSIGGGNGTGETAAPGSKPKSKGRGSSLRSRFRGQWQRFDKATGGNGIVSVAVVVVAVTMFVVLRALR